MVATREKLLVLKENVLIQTMLQKLIKVMLIFHKQTRKKLPLPLLKFKMLFSNNLMVKEAHFTIMKK